MGYNKDTDYQALIDAAVKKGDYKSAAQYEQQRNEKITALNATGGNKYNATTTNNYSGWLDNTDYGTIGKQQMALGASADDVLDTYNKRYNKANGTVGLQQYANDDLQAEMWDYILANQQKAPTFDFDMGSRPTYESQYKSQIDGLLNQLLNRDKFSYDHTQDPLYQQYQQQYLREGDRAMRDTLAEAASGAGGMNSYAITAAQQANNYYASQLADKIPELYQLAYNMYLDDIELQVQDLGLLQQMDNTQYDRFRDTMGDWYNDRDFAYGQYRDNVGDYQYNQSFEYQKDRDAVADAWKEKEWDYGVTRDQINDAYRNQEWEYGLERDALDDSRYDNETAYDRAMELINKGVMPEADMLAQAGLTAAQAQTMLAAVQAASVKRSSSSGGGGGGSYSDDGDGGDTGGKWDKVVEWVGLYGEDAAENYIKENYKALGYSSQSAALAGWQNYLLANPLEPADQYWESVNSLGLGMISAEYVQELINLGLVVEDNETETVSWAPGVNANNYQQKMGQTGFVPGLGTDKWGLGFNY